MAFWDHSEDLTTFSFNLGSNALKNRPEKNLKEKGQFLTPPSVAAYMARQLGPIRDGGRLLEPAIGSGTLACAIIERLIAEGEPIDLWIDGFEIDPELCKASQISLEKAAAKAKLSGINIYWQVFESDFALTCAPLPQASLFPNYGPSESPYDYIIANPPYFKLNSTDHRSKISIGKIAGHTNIYTLFMAIATRLLLPGGHACFIVPRSFCSGMYFAKFRKDFFQTTRPIAFHIFESRDDVFRDDEILQENIIITFEKRTHSKKNIQQEDTISISSSRNTYELSGAVITRNITTKQFIFDNNNLFLFRLPTGVLDEIILEAMDQWDSSLDQLGLDVSTGPVVPFRSTPYLLPISSTRYGTAVPLLWMQHIKPQRITWPLEGFGKPQAVSIDQKTLLIPNSNYVILRRFSAKEDRRRLIAAPFINDQFNFEFIGLENHLNYIYRKRGSLEIIEAIGLSALLNSALIDRYFRIVNGNTQVNAVELRALPFPPMEIIWKIGNSAQENHIASTDNIDHIIFPILQESGYLPEDFPLIQETRIIMGKVEQAQEILNDLGLPKAQQNEISALTLLILAQLSEDTPWSESIIRSLRIHDIIIEIQNRYGRTYAENTRESIRRQVLHQFEQAGIVERNRDNPSLAINSPLTHYSLTEIILHTLQQYNTPAWQEAVDAFLDAKGGLLQLYLKSRDQNKVPLRIAEGAEYRLSPGKHNELEAAIVHEFGPRFAAGSSVLYIGDAANKVLILNEKGFEELGVVVASHGKLPDIVLYDQQRNWIYLIEAVTSHGPVSPKRQVELEELFCNCKSSRVYVTAFLDFKTFRKFISEIAWETEVWIAEIPDHLIHFNGEKFLGPTPP
ncbi:MAG: Eco57I restriction-modification methylase domain-containing protein [Anaerolineales bacterium]|nr:Eco57I restriction-modification methylase domain-containing protein [Anaerolineales bacterium]